MSSPGFDRSAFIDDLRTLVGFKTIVCQNPEEFRRANAWIRVFFAETPAEFLEFDCHGLTSTIIKPADSWRPRMIGDGHIEVVPASSHQFELREENGRLTGRGTADMKTQVLAMLYVMRHLLSSDDHHDFWLVLTEDEEVGSEGGVEVVLDHLVKNELLPPVVFAPDGGPNFGYVEKEKGIGTFTVRTQGIAAHASRPYLAANAIELMSALCSELRGHFPDPSGESDWVPSLSITRINAGNAANRIPDVCEATFDVRFTEHQSGTGIKATVEAVASRHRGEVTSARLGEAAYYPKEAEAGQRFIEILHDLQDEPPAIIHSAGASNGRHYAAAGDVHVLMSNPHACGAHGENEWVTLDSLEPYYELVYRTATMELP